MQGQTHPRLVTDPHSKDPRVTGWTDLSGPAADVPHRVTDSHRKMGPSRQTPYEGSVLHGQQLHPLKHAVHIFTDASKEGLGAHLKKHTARGTWSLPESKLHINYLELKVDFLALKEFQDLCENNIVLIATDNNTVVAYINKERGIRSCPLCALLWRILTWCAIKQVTLKA